ncbi:hypothetical protein RhiJN_21593 [Ceratobasidium sp. AG-Ba]|nr:hypothetical protein RhiJN_21593 [Ceratobasidium sp. AG-Ba]
MTMNRLPLELVALIAGHVKNDKGSITDLLLVNQRMYQALIHMAFRHVVLSSDWAVQMFAWAVCVRPTNPGKFVQTLKIGKKLCPFEYGAWGLTGSYGERLRFALLKLPCLRELSIAGSTTAINKCLYEPRIPFKLRKLELACANSRALERFLTRQTGIEHLRLVCVQCYLDLNTCNYIATDLKVLPRLDSFTGPIDWLQQIAPKRALSEIILDNGNYYNNPIPWNRFTGEAPLRSAGLYYKAEYYKMLKPSNYYWVCFLGSLREQQQDQAITKLVVYESLSGPIGSKLRETIVLRLKTLQTHPGFPRLERLVIQLADDEVRCPSLVSAWLGKMKHLDNWHKHLPRLRSAAVYGVEIV